MANNIDSRILALKKSLNEFNAISEQLLQVQDRGQLEKIESELQQFILEDAQMAIRNFDQLYKKYGPQQQEQPAVQGTTALTQ